ncbi:hypothetical protein V2J09_011466 [Rumex salicifolius]
MALLLRISTPSYTRITSTLTQPPHQNPSFRRIRVGVCRIRASAGESAGAGDTYLDMWKRAIERENMEKRFRRVLDNSPPGTEPVAEAVVDAAPSEEVVKENPADLERKTVEFNKILEVPAEKRDRVQRMQVIDRAAAAIAAARAILAQNPTPLPPPADYVHQSYSEIVLDIDSEIEPQIGGKQSGGLYASQTTSTQIGTPGPDFWSWIPPPEDDSTVDGSISLQWAPKPSASANKIMPLLEKDRSEDNLSLPFESKISSSLPPMQSLFEKAKTEDSDTISVNTVLNEDHEVQSSEYAEEAARALDGVTDEKTSQGTSPDGSRWWKITGVETRVDGVVCRWTLTRGVSADESVEWEDKYWEAADELGYKELGAEKSGRDSTGSVWHEYWKESMWQEADVMHMEKSADKWGKKGDEVEWQEKWWEHHDASGKTDKWAHKWCSLDPTTQVEHGHAHVWHESEKYTDKWAERYEGEGGWSKWGDKWDEHFDMNSHGVKQGETWWHGKHGDEWNRTWGEQHNGSGWVHKYGKSSSGEHWDNHAFEETWYDKFPHYGFMHCLENTVQLRQVKRPSESEME